MGEPRYLSQAEIDRLNKTELSQMCEKVVGLCRPDSLYLAQLIEAAVCLIEINFPKMMTHEHTELAGINEIVLRDQYKAGWYEAVTEENNWEELLTEMLQEFKRPPQAEFLMSDEGTEILLEIFLARFLETASAPWLNGNIDRMYEMEDEL